MTTIEVPQKTAYDEGARVFAAMGEGLRTASDQLRGISFSPGNFATAEDLATKVEDYVKARQQVLGIFAEAAATVSEIVQLTGETYTDSERRRTTQNEQLSGRIQAAGERLSQLHQQYTQLQTTWGDAAGGRSGQGGGAGAGSRTGRVPARTGTAAPTPPSAKDSGPVHRFSDFNVPGAGAALTTNPG